jgi:hypothetical protein
MFLHSLRKVSDKSNERSVRFKAKKTQKSCMSGGLDFVMPEESRGDKGITIEVVSLNDVPLLERRNEANKPLYLARYE